MGSSGGDEEEDEGDHDHGGPVVRKVQPGRPCPTELHDEGKQGEHEDDPGEDEGDNQVGQVDVVLSAVALGPAVGPLVLIRSLGFSSKVKHFALSTVHCCHGPWSNGHPHPQDPGQRDGPLVHLGSSGVYFSSVRDVGFVLPIPEVEKQRTEYQQKCVDSFYGKINKQVEFAQKLR